MSFYEQHVKKQAENYAIQFLRSKKGQAYLKNTVENCIKASLYEQDIDSLLSQSGGKKFYAALEKAVMKRFGI